jgi:DnaJ-class molecular chaperone
MLTTTMFLRGRPAAKIMCRAFSIDISFDVSVNYYEVLGVKKSAD